jgi:peroxiredoxin
LELTFPVLSDPTGVFYETWDPDGVLPVSYIIDQQGMVAWAKAGGAGGLEEIEAQVSTLLGGD